MTIFCSVEVFESRLISADISLPASQLALNKAWYLIYFSGIPCSKDQYICRKFFKSVNLTYTNLIYQIIIIYWIKFSNLNFDFL